ncbi:MAG: enoyl-CoA hydratase/carnithine racemase, partial [Flavobacteriales bacterium]
GIGTTLLLHCDFVYAGPGAMFSLPFAKLGLCPEFASSLLLPRLAGMLRATEWLLLAEPFDVNEAYAGGLVTSIVDHPLEKALLIANVLVKRAPEALRSSKRLLRESQNLSVDDVMQRELSCFSKALSGPEFAEAGQAFFEKRAPNLGLK